MKDELDQFEQFHQRLRGLSIKHAKILSYFIEYTKDVTSTIELATTGSIEGIVYKNQFQKMMEALVYEVAVEQACIEEIKQENEKYILRLEEANQSSLEINNPVSMVTIYLNQIVKLQQLFVDKVQQEINDSRALFQVDDLNYEIHSHALAWQCLAAAFKEVNPSFDTPSKMGCVSRRINKLETDQKGSFKNIFKLTASASRSVMSLIRNGLLTFETQDRWGVSPLLLAIAANQTAIVQAFFKNGLASEIYVDRHQYYKYYTLIPYARTAKMLETILHFNVKPSKQGIFGHSGQNREMLYRQLAYHSPQKADDSGLTLYEHLLLSHSSLDRAVLEKLMPFQQAIIPEGPYDPFIFIINRLCLYKYYSQKIKGKLRHQEYPKVVNVAVNPYLNAETTKEYKHLLKCLQAQPDEDLPLIFKIDAECNEAWFSDFERKYGLTEKHLIQFDECLTINKTARM